MRGEPNAIGIRVKKFPSNNENAYYTDKEYEENIRKINEDLKKIEILLHHNYYIIIPSSGIGTGLAKLKYYAPRTFNYLQWRLDNINHD